MAPHDLATARVKKTGLVNAAKDVAQSLQDFELPDLQQFTREGVYSNTASKDFHLFYVGRDNVHEILKYRAVARPGLPLSEYVRLRRR